MTMAYHLSSNYSIPITKAGLDIALLIMGIGSRMLGLRIPTSIRGTRLRRSYTFPYIPTKYTGRFQCFGRRSWRPDGWLWFFKYIPLDVGALSVSQLEEVCKYAISLQQDAVCARNSVQGDVISYACRNSHHHYPESTMPDREKGVNERDSRDGTGYRGKRC
ncbi:hypothetical protein F4818DRAFT_407979 [Hypoxylon cercidicola]|nr:hypothetical protein F4818DRAFT_407979 [Hypoxylon cercidicola]